jgi:hypothetical protein
MKLFYALLFSTCACFVASATAGTYVGSTPAHSAVRSFLRISSTDSIDFIRWKLEIGAGIFKLHCWYGLAQPGTPGFSNGQTVAFEGQISKSENHYHLRFNGKSISVLEVNANVLHFVDGDNRLLVGNGGYSYALNSTQPVEADRVNLRPEEKSLTSPLVFEGRTPCHHLPGLLGLTKSDACNKMKWYFIFYTDSITGKPSYFLMGGMGYRKETMARGRWQIVREQNGQIIYRVYSDKWIRPLNLLKVDDNILFFTDTNGRLLVGNEHFSYTLNRRKEAYPPVIR